MIEWEDVKNAELGHTFRPEELTEHFHAIYGGVGWPKKGEGFAVVLGLGRDKQCGRYNIYLLDEFESMDLLRLVRQCGVLAFKYQITRWIGNPKNTSADLIIKEHNRQSQARSKEANEGERSFHVSSTLIMEDLERPYPYLLGTLQNMLNEECRQLHLKDESRTKGHLNSIERNEIADLELGTFPAIDALGFTAVALREKGVAIDRPWPRRRRRPPSAMC